MFFFTVKKSALSLGARWVMEYQTSDITCSEKTLSETSSEETGYKSKLRTTETFSSSKVTKNTVGGVGQINTVCENPDKKPGQKRASVTMQIKVGIPVTNSWCQLLDSGHLGSDHSPKPE